MQGREGGERSLLSVASRKLKQCQDRWDLVLEGLGMERERRKDRHTDRDTDAGMKRLGSDGLCVL